MAFWVIAPIWLHQARNVPFWHWPGLETQLTISSGEYENRQIFARRSTSLLRRSLPNGRLIAEGLSSKQISTHLDLQTSAVENHRRSLMNKVGVHNIADLVRFAVREQITAA